MRFSSILPAPFHISRRASSRCIFGMKMGRKTPGNPGLPLAGTKDKQDACAPLRISLIGNRSIALKHDVGAKNVVPYQTEWITCVETIAVRGVPNNNVGIRGR